MKSSQTLMNTYPTRLTILLLSSVLLLGLTQADPEGYYRFPALHAEALVFAAEGDLWTAPVAGGTARRLTSHAGLESRPAISRDGRWLAFIGQMDGADEVYIMPLAGRTAPPAQLRRRARLDAWLNPRRPSPLHLGTNGRPILEPRAARRRSRDPDHARTAVGGRQ